MSTKVPFYTLFTAVVTLGSMALYAVVKLEGYPEYWTTGQTITGLTVTRASNENSSNCRVTLADPGNSIAARLIEHVEKNGGLQQLPGQEKTKALGQSTPAAGSGTVAPTDGGRMPTGDVAATELPPHEKAFLDVLAYAEGTTMGSSRNGYDTVGGYGPSGSSSDRYDIQNFANHPYLTGEYDPVANGFGSDASGRYQFISTTWSGLGQPDFSPANQDRAAMALMRQSGYNGSADFDHMVDVGRTQWASLPASIGAGQPKLGYDELRSVYDQRLAYYQGTAGTAAPAQATAQSAADLYKSFGADTGAKTTQVFKGKKLLVTIADQSFEFFHQGTDTDSNGVTTITGQGGRWVMGRRDRNRTHKDLTLKALAEKVAKEHGMTLDWQADIDPAYEFIDQTGLSDYALLLRECTANGLFVTEGTAAPTDKAATAATAKMTTSATVLVVKSIRQLKDTKLVLAKGNNLISYRISDKPLNKEDRVDGKPNGTGVGVTEPKVITDMMTGQMKATTQEVDPAKSPTSLTGTPATAPTGTLKPGHEAVAKQNRGRVLRLKGLPSQFVLPLLPEYLPLQPLDVVRTIGLPGKLSRVWMVDQVTHDISAGTTTLQVFSPVEVIDNSPQSVGTAAAAGSGVVATGGGKWIVPCKGIVGDGFDTTGATYGRKHYGVDIAWDQGTPLYAMADGTVTWTGEGYNAGFGGRVEITHSLPDGSQVVTSYSHIMEGGILVSPGQQVTQGQEVAKMGSTGFSTGPHIHFQMEAPGTGGTRAGALDPAMFGWNFTKGQTVEPGMGFG